MPFGGTTEKNDDDMYSLSEESNYDDDDDDESYCDTHRTCSRYGSCNKKKHQHSSIDSTILTRRSTNLTKPVKGDIRTVGNSTGHQQKYDGTKWRRICCIPNCLLYLNGGIYFNNWLCRKHYLLSISSDISRKSNNPVVEDLTSVILENPKSPSRKMNKHNDSHKRGDLMITTDGIRQKYDGHSWRAVCTYKDCISFVVRHGYCHRHDMEMRKKQPEIFPVSYKNQQQHKKSKIQSQKSQLKSSTAMKPKKGDIQVVRQLWNGTKWYSLCHYYTRECTRRSAGKKCAFLCDLHYKEYLEKQQDQSLLDQNDQILLSPTVKRKKIINDDTIAFSNQQPTTTTFPSNSTIERIKHTEQCIQTDVHYPLESNDLREGCFFIDDDDDEDNNQCASESSPARFSIKKEEEDFIINKRKLAVSVNSLPINCKLELTKLEI